ncbi:hypothetical protein [Halobacterium zhouii]|uniref:hypothetical protein n=1 Tax=Halobacterium zhouii TaxID=2902624 RepID=UPI001E50EDF8|nr:hypothetical protein [Halobacterium zhouii]
MNKYETVIVRVFEDVAEANGVHRELTFTRVDLEQAMGETGIEVRCPSDILYAFRARRDLPVTIARHGFKGIEVAENDYGQEAVYKFAR